MQETLTSLMSNNKKILLIGTGGGDDIFSCFLPALFLKEKEVHIMGLLSPAAFHTYNGHKENVINKLGNKEIFRTIQCCNNTFTIPFADTLLPSLTDSVKNFYHLSLRPNMSTVIRELESFVNINEYDVILAVDVGGDILADSAIDKQILSPLIDFSVLKILSKIKTRAKIYLLEFGLGTDGEIRSGKRMLELLDELLTNDILLQTEKISTSSTELRDFEKKYNVIKKVRSGNTLREFFVGIHRRETKHYFYHCYKIGNFSYPYSFSYTIPESLLNKCFLLDVKKLARLRRDKIKSYNNFLELLIKYKHNTSWSTEFDLNYLWDDKFCIYVLDVNCEDDASERILREGLVYFANNSAKKYPAHFALIKTAKLQKVRSNKYISGINLNVVSNEEFAIVYKDGLSEPAKHLLKRIEAYSATI